MINNEEFIYIEDLKNDILRYIKEINLKCIKLEQIYQEYIQEAIKKPIYLTSLDVLFFQLELTKEDLKNYNNLFRSFLSKMYGQYYKFYNKMLDNLKDIDTLDIFNDTQISYEFTPYDDIDFKVYSFDETQKIHNVITTIINCIRQYVTRERYKIEDDTIRIKNGININHLILEKNHFIEIFENKCILFENLLSNYYCHQKKYLKRIILKLKLLFYQIDSDIHFESVTGSSTLSSHLDHNIIKIEKDIESVILNRLETKKQNPQSVCEPIKKNNIFEDVLKLIYITFIKRFSWLICIGK